MNINPIKLFIHILVDYQICFKEPKNISTIEKKLMIKSMQFDCAPLITLICFSNRLTTAHSMSQYNI